jgi:adenylate cyclase
MGRIFMTSARSTICRGCWQQLHIPVPLRGVASLPFRAVGIRRSRMNPNTCTMCETMFSKLMKTRQLSIEATVLFADLRGYTALSQSQSAGAIGSLLDAFYDECAKAIWDHDGLLNKTMGDSVMAVFNFPIKRSDHAHQAVLAARQIQEGWKALHASLSEGGAPESLGVGIGVDSGTVAFGEFGRAHQDITAIGTVVNRASRAQAAAAAGEILITRPVQDRLKSEIAADSGREYTLKGFDEPTRLWAA